jgi:hypothetical protein
MRIYGQSSGAWGAIMSLLYTPTGTYCSTSINTASYKITMDYQLSTPWYLATNGPTGYSMDNPPPNPPYPQTANITGNIQGILGCSSLSTCQTADTSLKASPGMYAATWAASTAGINIRFAVGGNSTFYTSTGGFIGWQYANCATTNTPAYCDDLVVTPVNEVPGLLALTTQSTPSHYPLWDGPCAHTSDFDAGFGDQSSTIVCSWNSTTGLGNALDVIDFMNFIQGLPTANSSAGGSGGLF